MHWSKNVIFKALGAAVSVGEISQKLSDRLP